MLTYEVPDVAAIAIYNFASFNIYGIQFFNTFWSADFRTILSEHLYCNEVAFLQTLTAYDERKT